MKQYLGDTPYFASNGRKTILKLIVALVAVVFIFRLAQLQIIKGDEYKYLSETQAIKQVRVEPFRGNLYDRNGKLIVHNEPSFSITLTPYDFKPETMPLLSSLLNLDSATINKTINQYKTYSKFTPIKIYKDANFEIVSKISEYADDLPGIDVNIESKRLYEFEGNLGHLLGYTREVTREQLNKLKDYYPGDNIGQSGIEQTYERDLRGKHGVQYVAVNKYGQKVASFDRGSNDAPATNGFDLHLGIDIKLQELAEKLLDGRRGAIVGIDPQSGDILVLASKPDYDPRAFTGKVPFELFKELSENPASPLLHRAIQSQYPPGSTWKMLIAMAAMQEGLIDESTHIFCGGGLDYGGRFRKCHGGSHGSIDVETAIKVSCNTFFYQLGLKLGLEKFEYYGKLFGFGQKTGIDLQNEKAGRLPTKEWLVSRLGKGSESYIHGNMVNYGIGQGEILVTPLQMAVYTAAIANEGKIFQPHLINAIKNTVTFKKEQLNVRYRNTGINPDIFRIIKNGMFGVVNSAGGTASAARLPDIEVCGKTGTAQNPHGNDHAWFVCFAPKENPKIALVVFVENAGFGGGVSAPIAHDILNAFFHPEAEIKAITPKVDNTKPDSLNTNSIEESEIINEGIIHNPDNENQ